MFKTSKLTLKWFILSGAFVVVSPIFAHAISSNRSDSVVVCDDVQDPLTLDPHKQFTEKNLTILRQIYEGLLRIDNEGKIEPALAVLWERLDPITVRFHLRKDVLFHDGSPFTADAVKYSLDRILDPKIGFPAAGFISSISSVTVVDPLTVDIKTIFPDGILLNRLASVALIVPLRKGTEADSLGISPVGTGPFIFEKWEKGREITLKANRNYWHHGFPRVGGIVFRFLPPEKQMEALARGEVDLVTEMPGTRTLEMKQNPLTNVVKKDTFYTVVGHFNTSRPAMADKRVRQAINLGINREELIRYDLLGNGNIIASMTMAGETGHNPDLIPYPYDPAKAKKLLTEAGFPNGLTLRTVVRAHGERTARILAKQLEAIGIKLDINKVTTDAEVISSMQRGEWDMGIAGLPDIMAHSFFIQSILLYSRSPFSMQKNKEYDGRLEQMASEIDPPKQEALGKALDKFVWDEALCLFTYQRIKTYGVSRRIKFSPNVTGMPYLEDVEFVGKRK